MQDAIALERKGTPSTVLVTKPFDTQARAMTTIMGLPGYQYAVMGHPMGSLTEEQVLGRANEVFPQVLEQLVS